MSGNLRVLLVAVVLGVGLAGTAVLAGYPADLSPGETSIDGRGEHGGHSPGSAPAAAEQPSAAVPGLAVAQAGLRLELERSSFASGPRRETFVFRVVDSQGRIVRDFEVAHERRMHFIVVRRDLASFEHLHPSMAADGTWTTGIAFGEGGTYRVFADFTRGGVQRTLGADVQVSGAFRPRSLPAPSRVARSDAGLEVELQGAPARAGEDARLAFVVREGGEEVTDRLQPYLGAKGHLVALREADLAYLHTHPESGEPTFGAEFPSAGSYRLFVQFRYGGRVDTAAFTQTVTG